MRLSGPIKQFTKEVPRHRNYSVNIESGNGFCLWKSFEPILGPVEFQPAKATRYDRPVTPATGYWLPALGLLSHANPRTKSSYSNPTSPSHILRPPIK